MASRKKKTLIVLAMAMLTLLVLVLSLYWYVGRTGGGDLEQWIGRQIVAVIGNYIRPDVEFDDLDYQAPYTVVIQGLSLSKQGTPLVSVARTHLELAEIPKRGKPIQIRRIEMDTPRLQFLAAADEGFVGWNNFFREGVISGSTVIPEGERFSDILVLRHVVIREGELVYSDAHEDEAKMTLPGIELDLQSKPLPEEPGRYRLNATVQRDPLFTMTLDSRLNVDAMDVEVESLDVTAGIARNEYDAFPPEVQRWLARHQVQGQFAAHVKGFLPLQEVSRFSGSVEAELREAHVAYKNLSVPLEAFRLDAELPDGPIQLEMADFSLETETFPLLAMEKMMVQIGGLPKEGDPLHIREVRLQKPQLTIRRNDQGELAGWNTVSELQEKTGPDQDDSPSSSQEPLPTIRVDAVHIDDIHFAYEDADMNPLKIEGLDVALEAQYDEQEGSRYRIGGTIDRAPWLTGNLSATYHLDRNLIRLEDSQVTVDLTARQETLDDGAADFLQTHDVRGKLALRASGEIPLQDIQATDVQLHAQWDEASVRTEEFHMPMDRVEAGINLPGGDTRVHAEKVNFVKNEVQIASLDTVELEVASWPGADEKLHLDRVLVERPVVYLKEKPDGGYQGWSEDPGSAEPAGNGSPAENPPGTPFLDRIQVDRLEVRKAALAYAPHDRDEVFPVEEFNMQLSVAPAGSGARYRFEGSLARPPLAEADFNGRFDVSDHALDFESLEIQARLNRKLRDQVPPPLESFVREYGLRGNARLTWQGRVPLDALLEPQGRLEMSISDARFVLNDTVYFDVGQFGTTIEMPHGPLKISVADAEAVTADHGVFSLQQAEMNVPTIPAKDQPWEISDVAMTGPKLILVAAHEGGFAGWNQLASAAASDFSAGTRRGQEPADGASLRDAIILRQVRIDDGGLYYEDLDPTTEGMDLSGIDARVEIASRAEDARMHDFIARVGMRPVTTIVVKGELDSSRDVVKVSSLQMKADLEEQHYSFLPPNVQEVVREHEIRGQLRLDGKFQMELDRPRMVEGDYQMNLRQANVTAGDTVFPIDHLQARVRTAEGTATGQYEMKLLSGRVDGKISQALTDPLETSLTWDARDIQIEETLRAIQEKESKYSGLFESRGRIEGVLDTLPDSLSGSGRLQIRQARLMRLPVIRQLVDVVERIQVKRITGRDNASLDFTFHPDHLQFSSIQIKTDVVTLAGQGNVMYDGRLDLDFVGSAMGDLNRQLGILGDVFKSVEDQVGYKATGTLSDPKVRVSRVGLLGR